MTIRPFLAFAALICCTLAFRAADAGMKGSPYTLTTCPISGKTLGEGAVTFVIEAPSDPFNNGREIRVCCKGCIESFKADQAANLKKVDDAMIAQQLAWYPEGSCVVMPDEKLPSATGPDAAEAKNIIVQNQLVRLCCKKCVKKVQANPDQWLAKVRAQVVAAQKPGYPLDTCVISGEKLGDDAVDTVIASRLVRTCCAKCAEKAKADPQAAFAKLDAAKK